MVQMPGRAGATRLLRRVSANSHTRSGGPASAAYRIAARRGR